MTKKTRIILPACVALAVLYIILAARPLSKEIQFKPEWTYDIENATLPSPEESPDFNDTIKFKLGQNLGYISTDGKLLNKLTFPYKASVSSNSYVCYGTSSENIDFFAPDGAKLGTIQGTGFPYFTENKKYIFLPGGSAFAMLKDDGSQRWTFEASTPVTAFSSSEGGTVAGFADGTVLAYDDDGEIIQQYKPGGSTYEVILGAGVSKSARYVATLSGQDTQRFVISERLSNSNASNASIVFYKTLKDELTRQVIIKFSRNEEQVYYSCAKGIGVVNLRTMNDAIIPISGRILSILESDDGKEVFILSKGKEDYTVSVIEGFDVFAGSFSFKADSACIDTKKNALFVGRDSKLSKISIVHR